jgi:hypothetical protein
LVRIDQVKHFVTSGYSPYSCCGLVRIDHQKHLAVNYISVADGDDSLGLSSGLCPAVVGDDKIVERTSSYDKNYKAYDFSFVFRD